MKKFLHAKAYIFSNIPSSSSSSSNAVIAGSSNLTGSGLASNLELNLGRFNPETFEKAQKWFDELWDKAKPFDLASFFEEIL